MELTRRDVESATPHFEPINTNFWYSTGKYLIYSLIFISIASFISVAVISVKIKENDAIASHFVPATWQQFSNQTMTVYPPTYLHMKCGGSSWTPMTYPCQLNFAGQCVEGTFQGLFNPCFSANQYSVHGKCVECCFQDFWRCNLIGGNIGPVMAEDYELSKVYDKAFLALLIIAPITLVMSCIPCCF